MRLKKRFPRFSFKKLLFWQTKKSASIDRKLVFQLKGKKWRFSWRQLKYLPQVLSATEKIALIFFFALFFLSASLLASRFYGRHIKTVPAVAGTYTEAIIGQPRYINPLYAPLNNPDADLVSLIFSGLLKYDSATGGLKPDLCQKYTVSPDKKTYTFYLRPGLKWQDNEPLTADDVVFTFHLLQNKDVQSPLADYFQNATIKKINNTTVQITISQPYPSFPYYLTFGILPEHIWDDVNPANLNLAEYNLKPVGSGPYQIYSRTLDKNGNIKSYTLIRNNNYYLPKPFIKQIKLVFYPDYASAAAALKNRQVDGLAFPPLTIEKEIQQKSHLNFFPLAFPQYTALFFNLKDKTLKNLSLRLALRAALNKEEIKKALDNKIKIVNSPLVQPNWAPPKQKPFYNPSLTQKLLTKAGWKKEKGFFVQPAVKKNASSTPLLITITAAKSDRNKKIIAVIQKDWQKVGIKTKINWLDKGELKDALTKKNYQALLYTVDVSPVPDPYPFWGTQSALNLTNFKDKKVSKLLSAARQAKTAEQRKKDLFSFVKIIQQKAPAIFLYQPIYDYILDKSIKGVKIKNIWQPADRFSDINQWYLKTKKEFFWE